MFHFSEGPTPRSGAGSPLEGKPSWWELPPAGSVSWWELPLPLGQRFSLGQSLTPSKVQDRTVPDFAEKEKSRTPPGR